MTGFVVPALVGLVAFAIAVLGFAGGLSGLFQLIFFMCLWWCISLLIARFFANLGGARRNGGGRQRARTR